MHPADTAAHVAAILNAAYMVRHHRRPHAHAARALALAELGRVARSALAASADDEALLYALAVGLYSREDSRFTI